MPVAVLAGAHKSGRLANDVAEQFPFDAHGLSVSERAPYTALQLQTRVARFADFAARFPQLLPKNLTSATWISQLADEVVRSHSTKRPSGSSCTAGRNQWRCVTGMRMSTTPGSGATRMAHSSAV